MKLVLCPRCELNYMMENEQYCKVCQSELHGTGAAEEVELCSVCNEAPALPGRDVCLFCLKEMNQNTEDEDAQDQEETVDSSTIGSMDSVAQMDEILPEMEEDNQVYGEMADALSLEQVQEEEGEQQDAEDEEDEEI